MKKKYFSLISIVIVGIILFLSGCSELNNANLNNNLTKALSLTNNPSYCVSCEVYDSTIYETIDKNCYNKILSCLEEIGLSRQNTQATSALFDSEGKNNLCEVGFSNKFYAESRCYNDLAISLCDLSICDKYGKTVDMAEEISRQRCESQVKERCSKINQKSIINKEIKTNPVEKTLMISTIVSGLDEDKFFRSKEKAIKGKNILFCNEISLFNFRIRCINEISEETTNKSNCNLINKTYDLVLRNPSLINEWAKTYFHNAFVNKQVNKTQVINSIENSKNNKFQECLNKN